MTPEQLRAMREGRPIPQDGQQPMIGDGSGLSPQEQQMMMAEMQASAYNPMLMGGNQPDIRRIDRWMTTRSRR